MFIVVLPSLRTKNTAFLYFIGMKMKKTFIETKVEQSQFYTLKFGLRL